MCLLDLQLTFSGVFLSTTSTARSSFSPSLSDSPVTTTPGVGVFRESQPNLRRLSTQILTFGSSAPSPTAEMLTAAQETLK